MFSRCIGELLDALDRYIPEPKRAIDKPFLMPIEGVHTIEGRGTVATGKIEQGVITVGQKVEILGLGDILESVCTSVEAFNEPLDSGRSWAKRRLAAARHQERPNPARPGDRRPADDPATVEVQG